MIETGIGNLAQSALLAGFGIAEATMVLVVVYFIGVTFVRRFLRP